MDITFGNIDEDHNSTFKNTSGTISILDPKLLASTLYDEVVQNEEEAKSSSNDFPLNYVQNLLVIASESEEKFDFSPSDVVAGVKICDTLDILEEISDYQSDPFGPHDLDLPANSCRIACTKIQNFEEEESCASSRLTIYLNLILTLLDLI